MHATIIYTQELSSYKYIYVMWVNSLSWLQLHLWGKTFCTLQTAGFLFTSTVMGVECDHLDWQIQAMLLLLTLISGIGCILPACGYSACMVTLTDWGETSFPSLIYARWNFFSNICMVWSQNLFYKYVTDTVETFLVAMHHLASHTYVIFTVYVVWYFGADLDLWFGRIMLTK